MTEHHPLVAALVADIPTGTVWPVAPRERWLIAAAAVFDLVYGVGETIDMSKVLARETAADTVSSKTMLKVEQTSGAIDPGTTVTYESEPERKDVILQSTVAPARNVGGRPKTTGPARPEGIPTNLNMALDAIDHHDGKASASQIIAYVRRQYWDGAPSNWTASLYDQVTAKKLARDGINFIRPAVAPKIEEKPIASISEAKTEHFPPVVQPAGDQSIRFEYGGKFTMLSKTQFRVAEALRRAMGKGHLDYAYLMQAGTAGQHRKSGLSEKVWCMEVISGVRSLLAPIGLEIMHSPDYGYSMRATAVD